ncbi:hypothetical protein [Pseudomonas baetica]|uniref:hypothetical protein n=1 Tax=Pseudomonas baetica TaxID=674054 RepID=UPI002406000B|nr:hypothetical protein [Pseudomonas baetica]MDF9779018.1 hypothetical protein [Pseudomonas baetica]
MNTTTSKAEPTVRLDITLTTADECQGRYSIAIFGSQRQELPIEWTPGETDSQTETVTFALTGSRFVDSTEELSGETWRTLESFDLTEQLIDRLLEGEPADEAAEALIATL